MQPFSWARCCWLDSGFCFLGGQSGLGARGWVMGSLSHVAKGLAWLPFGVDPKQVQGTLSVGDLGRVEPRAHFPLCGVGCMLAKDLF